MHKHSKFIGSHRTALTHVPAPRRAASVLTSAGPSANSPVRFLYVNHERWSVYESVGPYDRRSAPDLIFESETTIRRVRTYPANWRELSDDDLWVVSWHR